MPSPGFGPGPGPGFGPGPGMGLGMGPGMGHGMGFHGMGGPFSGVAALNGAMPNWSGPPGARGGPDVEGAPEAAEVIEPSPYVSGATPIELQDAGVVGNIP